MKAVRMKSQAGFSLIELMIVVAIIGILASVAVPNFQKFQRRAKQSEGKGYVSSIFSAEKSFQAEWNSFSSCLGAIGFQIDGRGQYRAGFAANTAGVIAGNNATTAANCPAASYVAQPPTLAAGVTAALLGAAALPAGTDSTAAAFTAGTVGLIGGANPDQWSIDQLKNMTNVQSGL